MKTFLLLLMLTTVTGCTVRGGWPRFMRSNEIKGELREAFTRDDKQEGRP